MTFEERIDELAKEEGIKGLAERLGVSRQTIWNWKSGAVTPSLDIIEKIGGTILFKE